MKNRQFMDATLELILFSSDVLTTSDSSTTYEQDKNDPNNPEAGTTITGWL